MDVPVVNGNVFRCKVDGCAGNMIVNFPAEVKLIGCPSCGVFNCRNCNAVHTGMTCRQFIERRGQNNPAPPQANRNPAPVVQRQVEERPVVIPVRRIPQPQQPIANQRQPIVPAMENAPPRRVQPPVVDGIHFNCKTGGCKGYLNLRNIENIKLIACPACGVFNCFPCQAIHNGMTCKQYRARMGIPDDEIKLNQIPLVPQIIAPNPIVRRTTIAELQAIDDVNLIVNLKTFECIVCMDNVAPGKGVIIRSCGHECCKMCLADAIANSERAVVLCIMTGCSGTLQDREIRELVTPEIFDKYTTRSLLEAQKCIPGLYMCRTPDCGGMWCFDENDNLPNYRCGMCNRLNCHKCKAIHETMTCAMYLENFANQNDPNIQANYNFIADQIKSGSIMQCPGCPAIVERDEGCSWIQCSQCKMEICWATRGPRWGPKGQGDISGGCKCNYKGGTKCHPDCIYCH